MGGKVRYLHPRPDPIGHFLRVGSTGHRQLETMHGSGRLSPDRVVFDAAWIDAQLDLLSVFQENAAEIVLDTNIAELSALGRYDGAVQRLPWANKARQLELGDSWPEIISKIARFAVSCGVHAVLAPTHLLQNSSDKWFALDVDLCETLRRALDSEGGRYVAIDYPLVTTYAALRDRIHRRAFIAALQGLPFENLWVRISGFGADASAVGTRNYITGLLDFHKLSKPIVADCVGGLTGLSIAAFGASGAIAHGVAEKERFDARDWTKPRREIAFGRSARLYLPGIDRLVSVSDARVLFEARGARQLLSCHDRDCCPRGADDMLKDPKTHFVTQRQRQLRDLSAVPERRRVDQFLRQHLRTADRTARQAAKLRTDVQLTSALVRASQRLDKLREVLEDLQGAVDNDISRSRCPSHRAGADDAARGRMGH
jgi:hypothetical protein